VPSLLKVYCVYWGNKYHKAYVYALQEAVKNNLLYSHEFICVTDSDLEGVTCVKPSRPDWEGWWSKLNLFDIADGPSLYFDLDVIITGNLDHLVKFADSQFAAPANWARSGHGGIQSSVMAWDGTYRKPFDEFNYAIDSKRLHGDQCYLWELLEDSWVKMPGVFSYKYHCSSGVDYTQRVVVFHGKPDPHETEGWTLQYTTILRRLIKESTQLGLQNALKELNIIS